jgi:hypothetical protein
VLFGKKTPEETASQEAAQEAGKPGGKGHATRTRKEAEAAQRRPLVPIPSKEDKARQRAEQAKAQERMNLALQNGDERYLPARDKGPVRRYIRDWIDSRTMAAEFFIVIAVLALVILWTSSKSKIGPYVILAAYILILLCVVETIGRTLKLRHDVKVKFGEVPRGTSWYAVGRMMQMRRTRLPKPQVKRRQYPE